MTLFNLVWPDTGTLVPRSQDLAIQRDCRGARNPSIGTDFCDGASILCTLPDSKGARVIRLFAHGMPPTSSTNAHWLQVVLREGLEGDEP